MSLTSSVSFFFFNDTATTEIYTLSLHDALPISFTRRLCFSEAGARSVRTSSACSNGRGFPAGSSASGKRSEEHTSELQSHLNLVCRLLLEKKKKPNTLTRQITVQRHTHPRSRQS